MDNIVVLIAAHNEALSIVQTLESLGQQQRRADAVIVAADNCSDDTANLARSVPGVTVYETVDNTAKKPGALNQAWRAHCTEADLVVCIDADTTLAPNAIADWAAEFEENPNLAGCSGKFTMLVSTEMNQWERLLVRLQRAEFAKWTDVALRRGRRTTVLAGTACALRNAPLHSLADRRARAGGEVGPWIETSMVEDFELTYRLREKGWETKVSGSVRAYTDAMTSLRSLWAQRMKWQTGTVNDLLVFGYSPLTRRDWVQQGQGLLAVLVRVAWIGTWFFALIVGRFQYQPAWLIPPIIFVLNDVKQAMRIPHRDNADLLVAALLLPQEMFAFMRAGWFVRSWGKVLDQRVLGLRYADGWSAQAKAEASRKTKVAGIQAPLTAASETPAAKAA